MIISKAGLSMFVINATCNGCRLEALNFGALNVVFNTWVFFTYEIWAEFKKSCGNTVRCSPVFIFYVRGKCKQMCLTSLIVIYCSI